MLEISNVYKNYGKQKVLKGVNLDVNKSEIVCLLGDNGEGKTTLLNIIANITVAKHGDIFINKKRLSNDSVKFKMNLGYVPDSFKILEYLSVCEYIEFVVSMYGIRIDKVLLNDYVNLLNLENELNKQISKLSKGNKKKVLILTSFLHNPSVIIMDEPLDGLDLGVRDNVKKCIIKLRNNKSILISTHEVDVINDLADKVAILHKGIIKEFDTIDNLKRRYRVNSIEAVYRAVKE